MANTRNANTFYIDTAGADAGASTAGNLAVQNIKVLYMIISPTTTGAALVLEDVTTEAVKFNIQVPNAVPVYLDFSRRPVVFPNGIHPATVTNARATLVIEETRA